MTELLRVVFVDDETHILRGIRRSMVVMEDRWDMTFCPSAEEALALMAKENPFDVVVSDMRMPRMDGAEFLTIVRERHPETIRVILSGYADMQSILQTVGPAHLYLAKPCSAEALRAAISRPLELRRLLTAPKLRAILAGLSNLPSLPDLFLKLEVELRSPDCSAKSVAALMERDMAMTAELLRLTNSSYFSVAGPVTTTLQAVRTIGLEVVQSLVLQIGIFRQFTGSANLAPVLASLTEYSMRTADLAEAVARSCGGDLGQSKAAHCAAMLAQIGIVVLLDAFPDAYARMLSKQDKNMPLHVAEEAEFGANHAVIGAYLLGLWGFAPTIVEAVAYACNPSSCSRHDNLLLTALHAAQAMGRDFPIFPSGGKKLAATDMKYFIEARQDGHMPQWRQLAESLCAEVRQ